VVVQGLPAVKDPSDKPPRTGIDKFVFGPGDGAGGLSATWWGVGGLGVAIGTIVLLLDGVWWAILFIPFAAWQFWMMKKAVDRRNF